MKLKIEIDLNKNEFEDFGYELEERIFPLLQSQLDNLMMGAALSVRTAIRDAQGNMIGYWEIAE